jgi:hypothetical protein
MAFPFTLPTTSHLTFQTHFLCSTHPSLPSSATQTRSILRSALKAHKRLSQSQQSDNLRVVNTALLGYLPYLLSIDAALSGKRVSGEDIDLALISELDIEWRPMLSASAVPGRDAARVKAKGLDYEIYSALSMLANLQSLLARESLQSLHASTLPSSDQRLASIQAATKALSTAYSIHAFLLRRSNSSSDGPPSFPTSAIDLQPTIQGALSSYTLASQTLLFVLKDDPYPNLLIQSRSKTDKEWMIKAPEISKVRAHLLARLCLSAAEHAERAVASLRSNSEKVSKDFIEYCADLQCTACAKACRFFGLDADVSGRTGEAIAWLHAGLASLGIEVPSGKSDISSKFSKLKVSLGERREEKMLARGGAWGADAGKAEEGRILEWLERRWRKMNDTANVQIVPEWKDLVKTMPSGRDMPLPGPWQAPMLDESELARMRAPPEVNAVEESSSGDEDGDTGHRPSKTPGSFPGDDSQSGNYY